jgi:hypothetical protein
MITLIDDAYGMAWYDMSLYLLYYYPCIISLHVYVVPYSSSCILIAICFDSIIMSILFVSFIHTYSLIHVHFIRLFEPYSI